MFLYLSLLSLFRLEQQSASLNSELSICVNAVDQTRPDQDWDIATHNQYDSGMNEAIGSSMGSCSTASEAVTYLSYALAMRNFADNPEQAMLTAAGTYVGEVFNDEFFRSVA
jgi:hypothetical protein